MENWTMDAGHPGSSGSVQWEFTTTGTPVQRSGSDTKVGIRPLGAMTPRKWVESVRQTQTLLLSPPSGQECQEHTSHTSRQSGPSVFRMHCGAGKWEVCSGHTRNASGVTFSFSGDE